MNNCRLACNLIILLGVTSVAACGSNSPPPPPLPVQITQRNASSFSDGHKVARFTNTSTNTLSMVVTFRNDTFSERKTFNVVLRPSETKEIGWLEGWDLLPGETATITAPGYQVRSVTFTD